MPGKGYNVEDAGVSTARQAWENCDSGLESEVSQWHKCRKYQRRSLASRTYSRDVDSETNLALQEEDETRRVGMCSNKSGFSNTFSRLAIATKELADCHGMEERLYLMSVYDMDEDGDSLLHLAIILGKCWLAVQLINICPSSFYMSCINKLQQTPLHLATITHQTVIARRLVAAGACLEVRNKTGNTALHIASKEGFGDIVRCFLEPVHYHEISTNMFEQPYQQVPQNLELKNYEGLTCLHLAAHERHHDIVKILIKNGADVNARESKTGRTILHVACLEGDLQLVKFLLKCIKCDINARTYDDHTPFDFAKSKGHSDVTLELAVAGARYSESIDLEL